MLSLVAIGLWTVTSGLWAEPPDGQEAVFEHPFYATFSLCALDEATGEIGVAVTTRVPFVGRAVPWTRAGIGAVATQSWTVVEYGREGLDLLEKGVVPEDVLERLLANDLGRDIRQIGVLDARGRSAAHTGDENGEWAGSRQGEGYTVQGNVLVGPQVVDAVASHFESTVGTGMPLAERMLLAMEAGQELGGDKRWGNLQSAAIRISDPSNPGRGGDHLSLSIDVGEHAHPIQEMKRIYYRTARRLGYREFSAIQGPDVVELKRMLHTLGFWRKELETFPEAPGFTPHQDLLRRDPDRFMSELSAFREEAQTFDEAFAIYDAEAMDAVDAFRAAHDLEHSGNPRGLVDQRLVEALRREVHAHRKSEEGSGR